MSIVELSSLSGSTNSLSQVINVLSTCNELLEVERGSDVCIDLFWQREK